MALEEYRRKRDFKRTPEPGGKAKAGKGALSYVIHKHAASHLHWDFRIELDGVLLSWAVPKGPSFDPTERRLAMHVEDHPIEYGGFEGTIPKGEYGGGTVMIWDRGTWEPFEPDPRAHVAQGHLKMVLHGERLQGRWVLVRTHGYGDRDSWLLIKEHDGNERPHAEFDPVAEWTTSVASGRTMDEIAAGGDSVWHSDEPAASRPGSAAAREIADAVAKAAKKRPKERLRAADVSGAVKAPLPASIDVELATLVKQVPQGDRWIHEVKFDGYRILAFAEKGGRVRLVSRNGKDWTDRFAEIGRAVAELGIAPAILDGEVVVLRPDGTSDFQALQNSARAGGRASLHYFVFDLLYVDGYDLRRSALSARKEALASLLEGRDGIVHYTDHIEGRGDAFYSQACEHALEGVVSKRADAPYRAGRQKEWLKTKCLLRQEFVIVGWTDPGGSRQGFGSLLLGVNRDGRLHAAGRVGTGFDDRSLAEITARLAKIARDEPPVVDAPRGAAARGVHWVDPVLVGEVAFAEWTQDDSLRHPSFLGLREDKAAADVVEEKPADLSQVTETSPAAKKGGAKSKKGDEPIVAGVRITNPDRVLWPDVGVTKLELVRYYESVADLMLPHVADRPLSLVRCPTGFTGECFFQKSIHNFPASVKTVPIWVPDDGVDKPFGRVTDLAGIVGLAQMGVLEIHPWGSRADEPDKPDRILFDLDPDPELPFEQVAATALLLRSELERLGLRSWLKTTGGKGLHVVVPVQRRYTWDDVRLFARAFVDSIVALEPALFTGNMSKSQRGGRIFIDYLRNARGATAVGAYSTRARAGAPVSVPLAWEELEALDERPDYTLRNLRERVGAADFEDPWAEIGSVRQSLTRRSLSRLGVT